MYFCPPPLPKAKAGKGKKGSKGAMTGDGYDLMLHCTIAHLRRVDGAQPAFDGREKAVNLFAPPEEARCIFCIFCIFRFFVWLTLLSWQTLLALVAACLWVLVLFHDPSWHFYLAAASVALVHPQD
jgi:hypothetical protein